MIICKKNNKYYFFLANLKCGSSMLQEIIKNSAKKYIIHNGRKTIDKCNNNPNNIKYNHCGIKGVIEYIQRHNIDRNNTIIISTIRNPYKRVISGYFWRLKQRKKKYLKYSTDINNDIEHYINDFTTRWTKNHLPNQFRRYLNHSVDVLLRLEFFAEDINDFNKKYDFILNYKNKRTNVNKYNRNITLNNKIKDIIYNHYELDFIEGHYDK